jgi:hypothetical protein
MYQHFSSQSPAEGWNRNELVLVDRDHHSRADHRQHFLRPKRKTLKLGAGILQTRRKQCLPYYAG